MRFINNIQLAYFTVPKPEAPDAMRVWNLLFGSAGPDEFKRVPNHPGRQTFASSSVGGIQTLINCQIGRIDVTVSAIPDNEGEPPNTTPTIADADRTLSDLAKKAEVLAGEFPLARGAFVINQMLPLEDDVRSIIEQRTGVKFPADSIDPMLQYNVRLVLKDMGNIQVNQVSGWKIVNVQLVQIDPGGSSPFAVTSDQHLNHKVDVNTVPNQSLAGVNVGDLFMNLSARAAALIDGSKGNANG